MQIDLDKTFVIIILEQGQWLMVAFFDSNHIIVALQFIHQVALARRQRGDL